LGIEKWGGSVDYRTLWEGQGKKKRKVISCLCGRNKRKERREHNEIRLPQQVPDGSVSNQEGRGRPRLRKKEGGVKDKKSMM